MQQVEPSDSAGPLQPNLALRYSTHKNLANIASQEGDCETAIENYLQVGIFGKPTCLYMLLSWLYKVVGWLCSSVTTRHGNNAWNVTDSFLKCHHWYNLALNLTDDVAIVIVLSCNRRYCKIDTWVMVYDWQHFIFWGHYKNKQTDQLLSNFFIDDVISGGVGGFDRRDSLAQDQQAGTVTAPVFPCKTCLWTGAHCSHLS